MKKRFLPVTLLLSLMFCCFCFAGCTEIPQSYEITVKSLHYNLGSVEGGNAKYNQGQTVTIKARPTLETTEFYCWLLNNKVVSTEKDHTFTVSSAAAGEYVALFSCPCLEYFSISEITNIATGNDDNTDVSKINIQIGKLNNLLTTVYSFEPSGETEDFETIYQNNSLPFAFDVQEDIFIKIDVTYITGENTFVSSTKSEIPANNDLSNSTFTHEIKLSSKATSPQNDDFNITLNNPTLTLNFTRLDNKNNNEFIFSFLTKNKTETQE